MFDPEKQLKILESVRKQINVHGQGQAAGYYTTTTTTTTTTTMFIQLSFTIKIAQH